MTSTIYFADVSLQNTLVSCTPLQDAFDEMRFRDCRGLEHAVFGGSSVRSREHDECDRLHEWQLRDSRAAGVVDITQHPRAVETDAKIIASVWAAFLRHPKDQPLCRFMGIDHSGAAVLDASTSNFVGVSWAWNGHEPYNSLRAGELDGYPDSKNKERKPFVDVLLAQCAYLRAGRCVFVHALTRLSPAGCGARKLALVATLCRRGC